MGKDIGHKFRITGPSRELEEVAETVKKFLDLCPDGECDHFWNIKNKKESGKHRVEVWLGTTWHDCALLLETVVVGLSASHPNIAVDYLAYSDDGGFWSELYSIRKGVEKLQGRWSCLLWNDSAIALVDLKSSKGGKTAALAEVTAALTKVVKDPDNYGTITADTLANSIVAAVGRNPDLPDDPAVAKNFVLLGKALASHGWPANWFYDDDDQAPEMPRKFRVLLESVCLSAATTGKKLADRTNASL